MPTVLIKRYPNRKLYNTEAKRYITLDTIADLIRDGNDVEVRDHETGEDLTGVTLSQIIFEREKKDSSYLPSVLLANLIRTGGGTLDYFRRSFTASVNAVRALEAEVDQRIEALVRRGELAEEEGRRLREEFSRDRLTSLMDLHILDSRVEAALHRLNMPSRVDMLTLQQQLEQLTETLDAALGTQRAPDSEQPVDDEDARQSSD
jgi:polyhydroxyalkanoate synthesis repressor PhaR